MTDKQRDSLKAAAWQHRPDLETTAWMDSDPYPLATIIYHPTSRRKVPAAVWWFLAACMFAALILF